MTEEQYNNALDQIWNKETEHEICNTSSFKNPCPNQVKIGILLAQRHGGSNWVLESLGQYSPISTGRERLIHWESFECSKYSQYIEGKTCSPQSLINAIDETYQEWFHDHPSKCKVNTETNLPNYFFFKVQIAQIPPKLFKTFVDYIYCHNIMILHLIRQSSVASFWSIQAETIERVNSGKDFHSKDPLKKEQHIQLLDLDPKLTADFVKKLDLNRESLRKLIKLYPKSIKHQQFDYEDLIGEYGNDYWESLVTWVGGYELHKYRKGNWKKLKREHPHPCFTKISNWDEVKLQLKGYDSYYSCEKLYS